MCDVYPMSPDLYAVESKASSAMMVDAQPCKPRNVHNVVDCDNDVVMIGVPIRADDKRTANTAVAPRAKRPAQDVVMTDLIPRRNEVPKHKSVTTGSVSVSRCYISKLVEC